MADNWKQKHADLKEQHVRLGRVLDSVNERVLELEAENEALKRQAEMLTMQGVQHDRQKIIQDAVIQGALGSANQANQEQAEELQRALTGLRDCRRELEFYRKTYGDLGELGHEGHNDTAG